MLVLTRKSGQKLIINDDIEIVILETKGDSVKIGIKAPKNVTIFREEVYEEIKKANKQSSQEVKKNDLDAISGLFDISKTATKVDLNKFKPVVKVNKKSSEE